MIRTDAPKPEGVMLECVRGFLFGLFKGATEADDKRWNRFWRIATGKEPGEMFDLETVFPRYTPFHKRHMKIEQDVFNAQDRFKDFEMFRDWLKIGSGFVEWVPGAKGGIVPLPKSISYAKTDEQEFREYHEKVVEFLRGAHAAPYLWKHLGAGAHEMMDTILMEFGE
ncbi:MAG: DUF1367 family protein [Candidatus Ferrigenium altingense]